MTVSSNPQTPTAFHGALSAVTTATGNCVGVVGAVRILAMPEMQAIKAHLVQQAEYADGGYYGAEWLRRVAKLPESVIEWVLS